MEAFSAVTQAQKARQAAQDQMVSAQASSELLRQTTAMTIAHNEEFRDSDLPIEKQQEVYESRLKEINQGIFGGISSEGARYRYDLDARDFFGRASAQQLKTADHNRYVRAHKITVSELDKNANDIAAIGNSADLDFATKQAMIQNISLVTDKLVVGKHLSAEDSAALAKAKPEMLAKAYAATAILKNPAEVVQMIDSGVFGKELDPTVAASIKDEAVKALPAFKEKAELMAALGDGKTFAGVLQKIATGDEAGAAVELANLPNTKAVQVFRAQLYKSKINEPSDPYQEARLLDRFLQLEYNAQTKTAKANALDMIEYMTDLSETRTAGGIDQKSFNAKLAQVVTPFLAKIGDDKPALSNVHATGWDSVKRFFGMDPTDPKGKTAEAVETYNDFATILGQQPKITSETVTASLRQALGNYARRKNPELAFMTELPDATMRPNGVPEKVGVGSEKKADQKVDDEAVLLTREGVTKLFPKSKEKALLANQWKRVNGNG